MVEEPRTRGSPGQEPQRHEGYLLKKRKWPLKGWHKVTGRASTRSQHPAGPGCRAQPWGDLGPQIGGLQGLVSAHPFPPATIIPLCSQRYFVLENGILKYATTRQDVSVGPGCIHAASPWAQGGGDPMATMRKGVLALTGISGLPQVLKGKLHGAIDIRQSVMSVNKKAQRVDLDTEENIYHLKVMVGAGAGAGTWTGLGTLGHVPPPTCPCPTDQVPGALRQLGEQPLLPSPGREARALPQGGSYGEDPHQHAGG